MFLTKVLGSSMSEAIAHTNHITLDTLPEIDMRHVLRLTDDTSIFQHAIYGLPDPAHGYCTDDTARALVAAVLHTRFGGLADMAIPMERYLTFLTHALRCEHGRFHNFMGYDRQWLDEAGSEDSLARALWALGVTAQHIPLQWMRELAVHLFINTIPSMERLTHVRSWATAILGLEAYLSSATEDSDAKRVLRKLGDRLHHEWQEHATEEWPWWEDTLTWGNARLCQGLLVAGQRLGEEAMVTDGVKSLEWLVAVQTTEQGHLSLIGNKGWYRHGGTRAQFDQQPIEGQAMVQACVAAARITGDEVWVDQALTAMAWFLGKNDVGVALYDVETGGCHDGLESDGVNKNQGAESALAYVLSVLELHQYRADTR
jgi:hypothetical protein